MGYSAWHTNSLPSTHSSSGAKVSHLSCRPSPTFPVSLHQWDSNVGTGRDTAAPSLRKRLLKNETRADQRVTSFRGRRSCTPGARRAWRNRAQAQGLSEERPRNQHPERGRRGSAPRHLTSCRGLCHPQATSPQSGRSLTLSCSPEYPGGLGIFSSWSPAFCFLLRDTILPTGSAETAGSCSSVFRRGCVSTTTASRRALPSQPASRILPCPKI